MEQELVTQVEEKHVMEWDECNIVDYRLKQIMEDILEYPQYEDMSEDTIREKLYEDSDMFEREWEYLLDFLSEEMERITKLNHYKNYFYVSVNNFGWRNLDGNKICKVNNGRELLSEILPKTNCTFRIFRDGKNRLKIQNFHHDSPMGNEWYYIRPMTKKEVEKEN